MIEKPAYGTACNNCGLCCKQELCPLAEVVFGPVAAPCPALEVDGDRYACGLVAHPAHYAPVRAAIHGIDAMRAAAIEAIGAGIGCDTRMGDEFDAQPPAAFSAALKRLSRNRDAVARRVMHLWAGRL